MIELTERQAEVYECVKRGLTRKQIIVELSMSSESLCNNYAKLLTLGAIERKQKKASIKMKHDYQAAALEYIVADKRTVKRLPKKRFSLLRYLVKNYGADNIRFVMMQKDRAELEYLTKKTGIRGQTLVNIIEKLEKSAGMVG